MNSIHQRPGLAKTVRLVDMLETHIDHLRQLERESGVKSLPSRKELRNAIRERSCLLPRCIEVQTLSVPWICGHLLIQLEDDHVLLNYLFIHRSVRGHGIGTAVIEKLKARYLPHKRIGSAVSERQLREQLFLRNRGFRAEKIVRNWDGRGDDLYVFMFPPKKKDSENGVENAEHRDAL